jgi:hypothetical protein
MRPAVLLITVFSGVALLRDVGVATAQVQGARAVAATTNQQVTAQFLAERGLLVEILGFRQWTPAMLRDSLAVRARARSLGSRTLATALEEKLGFASAAAWTFRGGDSAVHVVVAVIEPQDSVRVRRRAFRADTLRSLAPWSALVELARTRPILLMDAVEPPIYARAVGLLPAVPPALRPDSTAVRQIWGALEAGRAPEDGATARQLLLASPNPYDRLAAVAILTSFAHDDSAWHALVGALLDPDERVRNLAHRVLLVFAAQVPRRVEWRPAAAELHAVLNGSALFAVRDVLDVLVATGAGPELASPLLRDGGHAVLLFAGAASPLFRVPSYRFLHTVSGGQDHGGPDGWRAWIAELRP